MALPPVFVRVFLKATGIHQDIIIRYQQRSMSIYSYDRWIIDNHLARLGLSSRDVQTIGGLCPGFQHRRVWEFVFMEGTESWRSRLVMILRKQSILKRFIRRIRDRVVSIMKHATIIARNRKDGLPDVVIPIVYTLKGDPYFAAAFAGNFSTGSNDKDTFVVHVSREKTSQRVVEIFWRDYRWDRKRGKQAIYQFLEDNKENLADATEKIRSVGTRWDHPGFCDIVSDYLMEYINKTLFGGGTSMGRLHMFATTDPVLASYIWSTNFGTEELRTQLVYDLKISLTNQRAFIRSTTLEELQANLSRKSSAYQKANASVYDDVPPHIWKRVEECKTNLQIAQRGVPVGLRGKRYISSDDIAAAESNLQDAYREADRWIGRHRKRKSGSP